MVMKFKTRCRLRTPTGSYPVGCTRYLFPGSAARAGDLFGDLPALCFYPATEVTGRPIATYASEGILPGAGSILTNSYRAAPVSEGSFPLILFNHGFSLMCESNTVQCEELASHGYVVLSIGHPSDGSYELPDGNVLLFDSRSMMHLYRKEAASGMEIFPAYAAWLRARGSSTDDEEHRAVYQRIIEGQPKMTAHSELWVQDSLAALQGLLQQDSAASPKVREHIDTSHIGAFGMSYGGSTALNLLQNSPLIQAGADLDGFFYSPRWQQPIERPLLIMQNDSPYAGHIAVFPYEHAAGPAYLITCRDSTHGNFTDYNELLAENLSSIVEIDGEQVSIPLLGAIDPDVMENILNRALLDFFDIYLKGRTSEFLQTTRVPQAEIEYRISP
jgi:dienelactone hydrolase